MKMPICIPIGILLVCFETRYFDVCSQVPVFNFVCVSKYLRKLYNPADSIIFFCYNFAAIEVSKDIPGLEVEHVKIDKLPFLNTDLEVNGRFPDEVEEFRASIQKADSILFASPEYNYSMTAPLKNAIDWASRSPNCWADKPATIISAGGGFGGGRSQYHLRQVGVFVDLHFLNKPELFVKAFEPPAKFDAQGNVIHEETKQRIKSLLIALQNWTLRLNNDGSGKL
ncbi:hypothetical protein KP509_09G020500 [Ceratopteris richardii]|uniref:NAD(P)H dehydrogenase (quinone) n=1 Tax=Ceratopteris richardii TaxID=49495 RepID=A0A8T2U5H0_CERRI|nr:hypothetical protein KP509_09G020500 [Ceratopteris richardii]